MSMKTSILIPAAHLEDNDPFPSDDDYAEVLILKNENGRDKWLIWAVAPTSSYFNAAPIGSLLFTYGATTTYVNTAASTWGTFVA